MVLHCPKCGRQHIDKPEPSTGWNNPPHKSHLCHRCGCVWRPADVPTNGVEATQTRGERDNWPEPDPFALPPALVGGGVESGNYAAAVVALNQFKKGSGS